MLRSSLIYLSKAPWARRIITNWSFARSASSRFVAGDELGQAIEAVQGLNAKGINATIDHLGEHTTTEEEAISATNCIIENLEIIHNSGIRSNISIKLTQIGMALNTELCADNLKLILQAAKRWNNFVRVDMEDSACVDSTLEIYRKMRIQQGFDNCGVVIQAYLYRSKNDVESLLREGTRIRLCKGAYKESDQIAYPVKKDVDQNFDLLSKIMIDNILENVGPKISADGKTPPIPAIASHDPSRLDFAIGYAEKAGLPKDAIEFQMLYGIRRDLQEEIASAGYPVRVYVPYGTEWYPYFVRRLAERPANLWFFVSNFFRK